MLITRSHTRHKRKMGRYLIIIKSGTADPTAVHAAVVNGFAMVKGSPDNKVDFVLMAEGGWIVEDKVMRGIGAFGLPAMSMLLDAPEMNDPARVPLREHSNQPSHCQQRPVSPFFSSAISSPSTTACASCGGLLAGELEFSEFVEMICRYAHHMVTVALA